MFDEVVVMSGGHCTHPTGGPAIRLKHKKNVALPSNLIQTNLIPGPTLNKFDDKATSKTSSIRLLN